MSFFKTLPIFPFFLMITLTFPFFSHAANFEIQNNCPFTVWAAVVLSGSCEGAGSGRQLDNGQSWTVMVQSAGSTQGRIWARTGCNFNGSRPGGCETGDCGGLLECQDFGRPPNTLAEYSVNSANEDFFDISLVDGFNVGMEVSAISGGSGTVIQCAANINGQCPNELRTTGGCNNPCTVFKTDKYCCNSGKCGPTSLSKFFKDRCPAAYSYPMDDQITTFTSPTGADYKVVFCP